MTRGLGGHTVRENKEVRGSEASDGWVEPGGTEGERGERREWGRKRGREQTRVKGKNKVIHE